MSYTSNGNSCTSRTCGACDTCELKEWVRINCIGCEQPQDIFSKNVIIILCMECYMRLENE